MVRKFDDMPTASPDQRRGLAWRQNGRDMVSAEIEQMLRRRGSEGLPDAVPKTIQAAAAWVLGFLLDPPADNETIRQTAAFNGTFWATPYRDRAVYLARKFLSLAVDEQSQIIAYAKGGLRWRGDDVSFLALIAAEKLRGGRVDKFTVKTMETA